jgi:hypothetical protein
MTINNRISPDEFKMAYKRLRENGGAALKSETKNNDIDTVISFIKISYSGKNGTNIDLLNKKINKLDNNVVAKITSAVSSAITNKSKEEDLLAFLAFSLKNNKNEEVNNCLDKLSNIYSKHDQFLEKLAVLEDLGPEFKEQAEENFNKTKNILSINSNGDLTFTIKNLADCKNIDKLANVFPNVSIFIDLSAIKKLDLNDFKTFLNNYGSLVKNFGEDLYLKSKLEKEPQFVNSILNQIAPEAEKGNPAAIGFFKAVNRILKTVNDKEKTYEFLLKNLGTEAKEKLDLPSIEKLESAKKKGGMEFINTAMFCLAAGDKTLVVKAEDELRKILSTASVDTLKNLNDYLKQEVFPTETYKLSDLIEARLWGSEEQLKKMSFLYPLVNQAIGNNEQQISDELKMDLKLQFANMPLPPDTKRADFEHLYLTLKEQIQVLISYGQKQENKVFADFQVALKGSSITNEFKLQIEKLKQMLSQENQTKVDLILQDGKIENNVLIHEDLIRKFKELRHLCKANQSFLEQKNFNAEQVRIPFWYHATRTLEDHLKPILNPESGVAKIKKSEDIQANTKLYGGVSVSTTPELVYGRLILAFGNALFDKENGRIGKCPPAILKGRRWRALDRDVEINSKDSNQSVVVLGLTKYQLDQAGRIDSLLTPEVRQARKNQVKEWLAKQGVTRANIHSEEHLVKIQAFIEAAIGCPNMEENNWGGGSQTDMWF